MGFSRWLTVTSAADSKRVVVLLIAVGTTTFRAELLRNLFWRSSETSSDNGLHIMLDMSFLGGDNITPVLDRI
jgi:hypothetical protein